MRKRAGRFLSTFLSLALLIMCVMGNGTRVSAQGVQIIIPKPEVYVLVPGETTTVRVPIKAVGTDVFKISYFIDTIGTPYTATEPVLHTEGFSSKQDTIFQYIEQYLEFDLTVAESAEIGNYQFKISIYGTHYGGIDGEDPVTSVLTVNTQILEEKEPAQLTINNVTTDNAIIGKDMNLSFNVKNEGEIKARNIFLTIDYKESGLTAGYTTKNIKLDDIEPQKQIAIKLPMKTLPIAEAGIKTISLNFSHKNDKGEDIPPESYDIYITLNESEDAPNLVFEEFTYNKKAKPGESLDLSIKIKNIGHMKAVNTRISVDESSLGESLFIKDYFTDYIELNNVNTEKTIQAKVPLLISKEITGGTKELKLNLTYFDVQGVEYKSVVNIYPEIEAEGITEDGNPVIIISNVNQSPKVPAAGENLTVTFDMENKSSIDLNDLRIGLKNLTGSTFIPVSSDPYQYVGTLEAGKTKKVTLNLTISDDIPAGLNTLSLDYSYAGGALPTVEIPILDVQNDLGSASKPKMIVSNYITDVEDLRAGSVFNFEFDIRNTHSSVAAKNIIITVSGKDPSGQSEIFSVTQGSNSFFVNKIGPGETVTNTLEMKVKNDAATAAYTMLVTIDYEYDGIEPNPTTGKIGETEDIELSLQVMENARPMVDYVSVYSWDGTVTVGNPATMYFEFYNMGKSTLNNVVATVEGDLSSSGGSMYFMGNVMAGDRSYAEFEVIPNVEGMAIGVVKITYEDSNGDEQVYTKEFETMVMGAQMWEPEYPDGGMDVYNPIVPEPKAAILPTWAFVLALIAIAVIFIPVSRKVIINIYKSRLRKKEDEMY